MKTYEELERALALIEDESDWRRGNYGMGGIGGLCAEGALRRAADIPVVKGHSYPYAKIRRLPAYVALSEALPPYCPVWMFNDDHTHAEVVALFQRAIRQEKAKEGIPVSLPPTVLEEVVA